jgi:peptidoglycan/LPS O-acetylase OafA/YrhL
MRNTTRAIPTAQPLRGYLPTLDGWRAVAIGIVLLTHDRIYSLGTFSTQAIHSGHGPGGVELFFSISGLLIGSRLLEEERLNGTISLKNFYLRRCFRIQPAAWVYLSFIALLMGVGVLVNAFEGIGYSLLMVRNYFPLHFSPRFWYTDHFWSLSVEEHFYLFLPFFLHIVRRRRVVVLLGLVLLLLGWNRIVGMYPALQFGWELIFRTDFAVKGLLLSSAVAVALTGQQVSRSAPGANGGFVQP